MKDEFLTNYTEEKFIDKIKNCLTKCTAFYFSVSFIKAAGLVLIEKEIEAALKRGVKGYIITSTYQNFTDIGSLNKFLQWQENYHNFNCHLDLLCFGDNGFHSKGYLFEYDNEFELIVGSSNITRYALLKNIEWNVSLINKDKFSSFYAAYDEFFKLYDKTYPLDKEIINKYSVMLDFAIEKWDMDYLCNFDSQVLKPNYMQRKALKEIARYRDMGINKALIISATGSGKTYLAAFDAKNYGAKRLLFIVHRETILVDARKTFIKVFGNNLTYGLYAGDSKELDCDFIFTTNIMLSKHLDLFDPREFDMIIFDECHHITSDSYQKIMNYFKPGFLLGLTATPDRMDNEDVYSMFDKNVPFELRLRDALVNDLVVPFKYYGIRDTLVDYDLNKKDVSKMIRQISSEAHCEFIKDQIELHRPKGKLKAIGFCRSIEHARNMSYQMGLLGYNCIALNGNNNTGERIEAFKLLQDDNSSLEIIFTVDILNEGVDIPSVNMVLFLRPTESQTIFIQQLGRGLRKFEGKEYLTVLDFIGNSYERSVQMALAFGALNKNNIIEKNIFNGIS